jgi:hypothetical protein
MKSNVGKLFFHKKIRNEERKSYPSKILRKQNVFSHVLLGLIFLLLLLLITVTQLSRCRFFKLHFCREGFRQISIVDLIQNVILK